MKNPFETPLEEVMPPQEVIKKPSQETINEADEKNPSPDKPKDKKLEITNEDREAASRAFNQLRDKMEQAKELKNLPSDERPSFMINYNLAIIGNEKVMCIYVLGEIGSKHSEADKNFTRKEIWNWLQENRKDIPLSTKVAFVEEQKTVEGKGEFETREMSQ